MNKNTYNRVTLKHKGLTDIDTFIYYCLYYDIGFVKIYLRKFHGDLKINTVDSMINKIDRFENTLLMYACERCKIELIKLLLENGANIFIMNKNEKTALHKINIINKTKNITTLAAFKDYIDMMFNQIKDMNEVVTRTGETEFMYLCINTDYNFINTLDICVIKNIINTQDSSKKTTLMHACEQCKIELVKLLLKNGADIYIKDNSKKTAFDYITNTDTDEKFNVLRKILVNHCLKQIKNIYYNKKENIQNSNLNSNSNNFKKIDLFVRLVTEFKYESPVKQASIMNTIQRKYLRRLELLYSL